MPPLSPIARFRARLDELFAAGTADHTVEILDRTERVVALGTLDDLFMTIRGLEQRAEAAERERDEYRQIAMNAKWKYAPDLDERDDLRDRLAQLLDVIVPIAGDAIIRNGTVDDDLAVAWLRQALAITGATTNDEDPPDGIPRP